MELSHKTYRLLDMARRGTIVVVLALAVSACSSDGAKSTTVASDETTTTASTSTQPPPSSTPSTTQPIPTTVNDPPTLSDSGQSGFEDALGTSERVCVDVDQIVANEEPEMVGSEDNRQSVFDIRSGDILAGNFASVVNQWSAEWPDGAAKIYWIPFDHRVAGGTLEVTVEPLDTSDPPVIQTFQQLASNAAGVFWPSGTKFPQSGRYRLTATAPGHWGCFEHSVTPSDKLMAH